MSAAIKPEIYASIKLTKGFLGIAPEIYATIEISGKIILQPLIYATILVQPHRERVKADTCRSVKQRADIVNDTLCKSAVFDAARADTCKIIRRTEKAIGDTKKVMPSAERQLADTLRELVIPAGVYFTPSIWAAAKLTKGFIGMAPEIYATLEIPGKIILQPLIYAALIRQPKFETVRADTCRAITKEESLSGDTVRICAISSRAQSDTIKFIRRTEKASGDTVKFLTLQQSATGDTFKRVVRIDTASGDTQKIIKLTEKIRGDTAKIITALQALTADTLRILFIPAGAYFEPFIWASVKLTKGFIGVLPLIYATIFDKPHITRISADTYRHIVATDNFTADTFKIIRRREKTTADTLRTITISQIYIKLNADTCRVVTSYQCVSADTCVITDLIQKVRADTWVKGYDVNTAQADTWRKISVSQKTNADTWIQTRKTESIFGDTLCTIRRYETATADTLLCIVERARADTLKIISKTIKTVGDTVIRVPRILKYVVNDSDVRLLKAPLRDAPLSITNSFKDYGIISFSVTLNENSISDYFQIDAVSNVDINDAIQGQLLDYDFNLLVEETDQQDSVQTIKGKYDVDKLLYSQIFNSGVVTYGKNNMSTEMLEILQGHIVKEEDDYFIYAAPTAKDYINNFAKYLGLTPNIQIDDFTPYGVGENSNITYRDLLSSIFSWTSRLPQRQINVFIRGGTLHCIQRGKENSVFDISELPHSRPAVNKKLIRTLWNRGTYNSSGNGDNSGGGDNAPITPDPLENYTEEEIAKPFSGTISFSDNGSSVTFNYKKGLLTSETSTLRNSSVDSISRTTYTYKEVFADGTTLLAIFLHKLIGDFYLENKNATVTTYQYDDSRAKMISSNVTTDYIYTNTSSENIYLSEEKETTTRTEYELNDSGTWVFSDSSVSLRQTIHTPIGNGWYAQSVYVDGEPQGSNISQGKPGNAVSPYTINEVQKTFTGDTIIYDINPPSGDGDNGGDSGSDNEDDWRQRLSPIADISFPVYGGDLLLELTDALEWLNRKVQETISVDLISPIEKGVPSINHIVDFTERVALDGKEYYLVSNKISFNPRRLIQKLTLVRWYAQ